jgi:acetyl-CoA carboxylase biotin carboxylase subunit
MFVYAWSEKTNKKESKFGQRFVFAGQDPYEECLKRIRESIGVRKDLFDDGTIVLSEIWDVTKFAEEKNMMSKKSKFDDFLRNRIGRVKQGEVHNLTIEFLVDKHKNFYFMEMNTRIQVEHTVTEEVVDYDLIREQIKIAMGEPISGINYFPTMHAIECRINAEDIYNGFRPSPGKISSFHSPKGHGVRVDTHVYAGYSIPPFYDSMIAKLICRARTREECINKVRRALDEFVVEGVKTTIPFHQQLMYDQNFIDGNFTTKFLEDFEIKKP